MDKKNMINPNESYLGAHMAVLENSEYQWNLH